MVQGRTLIKSYVKKNQELEIQYPAKMSEKKYSERDKSYCEGYEEAKYGSYWGNASISLGLEQRLQR